ncbi:MAG: Hsp20/alpha crystallin family protein [Calditrichaeota bacterium]|nr:Hsp20/alpha crystallin family protein [Calditrichota bacterium]
MREFRFEYIRIEQGSRPLPWGGQAQWVPAVDILGNEELLIIEVHLPGVRPDDTRVEIEAGYLRVQGIRQDAAISGRREFLHMEIERGSFQRVIQLPEGVSLQDWEMEFDLGVMRIKMRWQGKGLGSARSAGRFPEEWS